VGNSDEARPLCLDDMQWEGDVLDISDSGISSLDGGFDLSPFDFVHKINFSNNPLTYTQIEQFIDQF